MRFRFCLTPLIAILLLLSSACGRNDAADDRVDVPVLEANQDVDTSQAPGADAVVDDAKRGATITLRQNIVRTRHLFDASVTAGKIAYKATTVTVAMGAASGVSSSDATLAAGVFLGCFPAGNQDQFMDNAALNASTGVITVTLAANATAANTFRCLTLKANAQGVP
jgi:hypothetical protein